MLAHYSFICIDSHKDHTVPFTSGSSGRRAWCSGCIGQVPLLHICCSRVLCNGHLFPPETSTVLWYKKAWREKRHGHELTHHPHLAPFKRPLPVQLPRPQQAPLVATDHFHCNLCICACTSAAAGLDFQNVVSAVSPGS
jgi:hypothetical protein